MTADAFVLIVDIFSIIFLTVLGILGIMSRVETYKWNKRRIASIKRMLLDKIQEIEQEQA